MHRFDVQKKFDLAMESLRSGGAAEGAEAERLLREVLLAEPERAEALGALAQVAFVSGRGAEAVDLLRRAVGLNPGAVEYRANLGMVLSALGNFDAAIEEFKTALASRGDLPEVWNNLAVALQSQGRLDEAIVAFEHASRLRPEHAKSQLNLARALQGMGRFAEAVACYLNALEIAKDGDTAFQLGICLQELGRWDEAAAVYGRAVAMCPDRADIRLNLAIALLTTGRLREGWESYRAREKTRKITNAGPVGGREWTGERLDGKTILLHAEQGFGDTLQFIRYAPMVAQRGGRVIVLCPRSLHRVIKTVAGIEAVVGGGDVVPEYDVQCSLLNLPGVFGTSLETIPNVIPYLFAETRAQEKWRERVEREPGKLKVGLSWAGNPEHQNDRNRSIALAELEPFSGCPGVTFFRLQKGAVAAQAKSPPAGLRLIDWTAELTDFGETAGLVANLDLVISVDTAMVHLCGALGKRVWVMLPEPADWRWMRGRDDSPWYPTARLFRQAQRGEWEECLERIAAELRTADRELGDESRVGNSNDEP